MATAGLGTALAVIRVAIEKGKELKVISNETRPYLQGARLTVWELMEDGIDVTLAADNASAFLMSIGQVQAVVVQPPPEPDLCSSKMHSHCPQPV